MSSPVDVKPIRQLVGHSIAIIEEPTCFNEQSTGVRPRAPGHPTDRPRAGKVCQYFNRWPNVLTLDMFRYGAIVDPPITIADDFVATFNKCVYQFWRFIKITRYAEDADIDFEVAENVKDAPDTTSATVFEYRFDQRAPYSRLRAEANVIGHSF